MIQATRMQMLPVVNLEHVRGRTDGCRNSFSNQRLCQPVFEQGQNEAIHLTTVLIHGLGLLLAVFVFR